ncbi:hypothetical protein FEZ33_01230 [Ruoffia tabacinasalis]|uniref:Uncharacterized protein n=1 Tax=Ruoffia tabacinasalis TaxID=87458 RepID=A0A5R9EJV4_9LACT|nr:hypothetical protein [Ruoffia tabacinasalis]TLQ49285.1 hypothetical protein FEZ33_01230 [Ruoffia tabacinasalis]
MAKNKTTVYLIRDTYTREVLEVTGDFQSAIEVVKENRSHYFRCIIEPKIIKVNNRDVIGYMADDIFVSIGELEEYLKHNDVENLEVVKS